MTNDRKETLTKGPEVIEYLRKDRALTVLSNLDAMNNYWAGVYRDACSCEAVAYNLCDYKA